MFGAFGLFTPHTTQNTLNGLTLLVLGAMHTFNILIRENTCGWTFFPLHEAKDPSCENIL